MSYKVGDKIKVKDKGSFREDFDKDLNSLSPRRVVTIIRIFGGNYWVKEIHWRIERHQIERLYVVYEPILNRFEILDIGRENAHH